MRNNKIPGEFRLQLEKEADGRRAGKLRGVIYLHKTLIQAGSELAEEEKDFRGRGRSDETYLETDEAGISKLLQKAFVFQEGVCSLKYLKLSHNCPLGWMSAGEYLYVFNQIGAKCCKS